jgi:hypothetical protein
MTRHASSLSACTAPDRARQSVRTLGGCGQTALTSAQPVEAITAAARLAQTSVHSAASPHAPQSPHNTGTAGSVRACARDRALWTNRPTSGAERLCLCRSDRRIVAGPTVGRPSVSGCSTTDWRTVHCSSPRRWQHCRPFRPVSYRNALVRCSGALSLSRSVERAVLRRHGSTYDPVQLTWHTVHFPQPADKPSTLYPPARPLACPFPSPHVHAHTHQLHAH